VTTQPLPTRSLAQIDQLIAMLQSTPTGLALLSGSVVVPITEDARTDVVGVPQGALNVYRDGSSRYLQIFDHEGTGAPGWFEVELT
jgi:hypothetical protein